MRYDTIIFDFDGTLADSSESIIKTIEETLHILGYKLKDKQKARELIGIPLAKTFRTLAGLEGEELNTAIKEYRSKYLQIALGSIKLFPKVKNTLNLLYNRGIKLAIASNRGSEVLNQLLKNFVITDLFKVVVGEQDVSHMKPNPEAVFRILDKLKTTPHRTLVVGDTVDDIEMGSRAKCDTCAVSYGNSPLDQLKASSPNFIIDNISQLLQELKINYE